MLFELDGIPFMLGEPADLGFLRPYGRCFRIWDRGPSGNICFGMEGPYGKLFVKYAGAKPVRSQCRPGEAEEYLLEAILTGVGDLCSAAFGYAFVLLSRGDAASLREMIGWERSLINGLFREAPAGVMHKVEMGTEILSAAAMLAEGQREAAREALRKAAEMAEAFDASPDYSLKALRFAALPENAMAWDSLGLTARESAETTLRLLKNKELEEMWKEVRKNA